MIPPSSLFIQSDTTKFLAIKVLGLRLITIELPFSSTVAQFPPKFKGLDKFPGLSKP